MPRLLLTAVLASVVSCLLTLAAVSIGFPGAAPAAAQTPQVIQARAFEVVDPLGNRVAYLGVAQVGPILEIGGRGQVLIASRSIRDDIPHIWLNTADGATIWTAP